MPSKWSDPLKSWNGEQQSTIEMERVTSITILAGKAATNQALKENQTQPKIGSSILKPFTIKKYSSENISYRRAKKINAKNQTPSVLTWIMPMRLLQIPTEPQDLLFKTVTFISLRLQVLFQTMEPWESSMLTVQLGQSHWWPKLFRTPLSLFPLHSMKAMEKFRKISFQLVAAFQIALQNC